MKQRDLVAMTQDEATGFLAEGRKVQLATNGQDGFPHLVTMYYVLIDGLPSQGPPRHAPVRSGEYRDTKYAKTRLAPARGL